VRDLAQPGIGQRGHAGVADGGVPPQYLLYLVREHLEAASVNHVAHPALDPEETVGVHPAQVAGAQEPVDEAVTARLPLGSLLASLVRRCRPLVGVRVAAHAKR
jgi:hypothetical protein